MKKLLIVVGALCLFGGRAAAWWEVKDNPDRFISFGVNTGMDHLSGSTNNLLNPNQSNETLEPQRKSGNLTSYGFDVRLPVMKYLTGTFSYGKYHIDTETIRGANTWQNHDSLDGTHVEMGFRFYLAN